MMQNMFKNNFLPFHTELDILYFVLAIIDMYWIQIQLKNTFHPIVSFTSMVFELK